MKYIITESQLQNLVMEVKDEDLQSVSNYLTRATRRKFPVVYDINVSPIENRRVNVFIYVNDQLERGSKTDSPSLTTEHNILTYVKNILTKFFDLRPYQMNFDSENFEYIDGNYKTT
jgi:hypothetical protein